VAVNPHSRTVTDNLSYRGCGTSGLCPSLRVVPPSQNPLPRSRLIPYDDPRVQMALHPQKSSSAPSKDSTANLGFEAKLWLTADKLRNNMDAAEYKHVVLGLIFLKYISDTGA